MDFKQTLSKFVNNSVRKFNTLIKLISLILPEILIIIGLFFIIDITFKISNIVGYYLLGSILLILGLFLAKER